MLAVTTLRPGELALNADARDFLNSVSSENAHI